VHINTPRGAAGPAFLGMSSGIYGKGVPSASSNKSAKSSSSSSSSRASSQQLFTHSSPLSLADSPGAMSHGSSGKSSSSSSSSSSRSSSGKGRTEQGPKVGSSDSVSSFDPDKVYQQASLNDTSEFASKKSFDPEESISPDNGSEQTFDPDEMYRRGEIPRKNTSATSAVSKHMGAEHNSDHHHYHSYPEWLREVTSTTQNQVDQLEHLIKEAQVEIKSEGSEIKYELHGLFKQLGKCTEKSKHVLRETTLEQTILPTIMEFVHRTEAESPDVRRYLEQIKAFLQYIWEIQKGITSGEHAALVAQLVNDKEQLKSQCRKLQAQLKTKNPK
jgi:hypothetical protein